MQAETVCPLVVGSGLTPLLGLLREALEDSYRSPVLWLHYARHPGQRAWLGELEVLAARRPDLELRRNLTRKMWTDDYLEGHFQSHHLDGWAADLVHSQALARGPAAFVEMVDGQLGVRSAGLQTKSFSVPHWRSGEAPHEVRLRFARSQREVSGDSTASPLEQAEAHGLRPAHGYRQSICASCTYVLFNGCVRDLRSGVLCSEPGQLICPCVSAAHGDLTLGL